MEASGSGVVGALREYGVPFAVAYQWLGLGVGVLTAAVALLYLAGRVPTPGGWPESEAVVGDD